MATNGTVYVADSGNDRVRAISISGVITTVARVNDPVALSLGPAGRLYVADAAGIQVIGPADAITTLVPSPSLDNGTISNLLSLAGQNVAIEPSAIAVTPTGDVYIADSSPKYLIEDSEGTFNLVGPGSVSQGGTYVTTAGLITAANGDIYVANYGTFAVDRVSGTSLTPILTFQSESVRGLNGFRPSGIAIGPNGVIFVDTDGTNGGSNRPALVSIGADHKPRLLAVGRVTP